tara:strand:- start:90838 stop:91854 length:1017 start_codon:yes stop_codon:yes gene_type:complete
MSKKILLSDRIFIAGSTGMAGSAIYRKLLQAGYGELSNGGQILTPSRKELDLLNYEDVQNWLKKNRPTVVVLAAAKVGGIQANSSSPADFLLENIKIQTNVIESAWRLGVRRLLFLGSSCIYPKYAEQPIKEEALLSGELEGTNESYAISKISGIKLCESLRIQHNFDAISLMPTNLYGPGDNYHQTNSHVLPALIRKFYEAYEKSLDSVTCWGSGTPLREFLHVNDLGDASVFALEKWDPDAYDAPKDSKGKPLNYLNIGTGKDISIKSLAEKIALEVGFSGDILWDPNKPDGTPRKMLSVNRINKLGWEAKVSLSKGIQSTVKSYIEGVKNQTIRL